MKNKIYKIILIIFTLIAIILTIGPLIYGIFRGYRWFLSSFFDEEVIFALKLSLKTAIISTILCVIISIFTTIFLYEYKLYKVKALISSIMSLPHIVTGVILLLFFGGEGIGRFIPIDFVYTVAGIVIAQVIINIPYAIEQIWGAFDMVTEKEIFMAKVLGANMYQIHFNVMLPKIKSMLLAVIIICFGRAIGEYGAVMMLAGTIRMKTEILPTAILLNMDYGGIDKALAIAIILIIISILINILAIKIIFRCKNDKV